MIQTTTLTKVQLHGLTHLVLLTPPQRGQDYSLKRRGKVGLREVKEIVRSLSTTKCWGQCTFQVHLASKHLLF